MTDLRKLAKGKPCLVRVPGCCNHNPETTVLAHYRLIGVSGMGTKSPDTCAAWACSACYSACDGQTKTEFSRDELRLAHAEGVFRTQQALINKGILKW